MAKAGKLAASDTPRLTTGLVSAGLSVQDQYRSSTDVEHRSRQSCTIRSPVLTSRMADPGACLQRDSDAEARFKHTISCTDCGAGLGHALPLRSLHSVDERRGSRRAGEQERERRERGEREERERGAVPLRGPRTSAAERRGGRAPDRDRDKRQRQRQRQSRESDGSANCGALSSPVPVSSLRLRSSALRSA
eukprot:1388709-Rhodomonas_salina.1